MATHDFVDIGDVLGFELLQGTITSVDASTDTCVVTVGESVLNALLFYHCQPGSELRSNGAINGAAAGFSPGQPVIVMKQIRDDLPVIKVIAHIGGIQPCMGQGSDFYVFYTDGANLKVANCSYIDDLAVKDTKVYFEIFAANNINPFSFFLKRFTHNVPATDANGNVTITARDLYFVATSLYIPPAPFAGWTAFAAANPAFPMVTNNKNTKIPFTDKVLQDLNSVNSDINHTCTYSPAGISSSWYIMAPGGSGACAEFALTKANALLELGYPESAIHVEVGFYSGSLIGHAWCVVQTTAGDFALDISSDTAMSNAVMQFTPAGGSTALTLFGRRRQIGSNWAFINSYGWMLGSTNQVSPYTLLYVLDPLLNIFYLLTPSETVEDVFEVIANPNDATKQSAPSVNFSEDNNAIHVADGVSVKTFKLNENQLALVNTQTYSVQGFVGRDGQIIEGEGLVGRQDPYNIGVGGVDVGVGQVDGVYYLNYIASSRLGDFKCLYGCEVISENGYFSYKYRYLTGTYSHVGSEFLIEWQDLDRPDEVYSFDNAVGTVASPRIDIGKQIDACFMSKTTGDLSYYQQWELLDPLEHDYSYQRHISDWINNYNIYGEEIPYYTIDPISVSYDPRGIYRWNHIEMNEQLIFRGALFNRTTDVGDNLKRMYKNGASCTAAIAAAVGCTEANLLGLAFIPNANRLM